MSDTATAAFEGNSVMTPHLTSSPVSLSYVAALRGVLPRRPGEAFNYADVLCRNPQLLTCLAASNPEGHFFGLMADAATAAAATKEADMRDVTNVTFLPGMSAAASLPQLDYVHCDASEEKLGADHRNQLFDLAQKYLKAGGLFHYSYRAYDKDDGALRFLVREFGPEVKADQKVSLLTDLRKLGGHYLAQHPDVLARLDDSISKEMPLTFLDGYQEGEARSGSFDTLVALNPRGFSYAGDSHISANYVELSAPGEAHSLIEACRQNALYEPIKDFALNRTVRSDIWVRQPVEQSSTIATLFGGFSYGIPLQRDEVPAEIKAQGKTINLASPLYTRLIELLTLMPLSVGDFMAHPTGQMFDGTEIVGALQILIACGLAQPMRGMKEASNFSSVNQPKLVGSFNQYLDKTDVGGKECMMASSVMGGVVALSAREALVMQAVDRGGLAHSVSALLPELERLAKNPTQAAKVLDTAEPTPEMARDMIETVLAKSMVQWYAYGLLEAA